MTTLRLLPIVLFATSSLLVLKVVGLATGTGSFAFGPAPAIAAGGGGDHGGGGGEGAANPADAGSIEDPAIFSEPLDLAAEAAELAKQKGSAGGHGGGGQGEPAAGGHGEAAPAGEHGAKPAAGEHGAAPAAGEHGAAPAAGEHGAEAAAAGEHGAAPAAGAHAAAPEGGDHTAAPAAGGHGGESGNGSGSELPAGVSTTRPAEYQPPPLQSEKAVLEALGNRRKLLDDREKEIDLRMKLLQAAEQKLQQRVDELKSIQGQLGQVPGAGGDPAAAAGGDGAAGGAAAPGTAGGAAAQEPESEQIRSLVSMYEAMKPKAAAEVFNTLDLTVLVAIARKMNPRKLSPILAAMQPSHAAKVTIALAGDQGPRQIVIRTVDDSGALPSAQYVEPPPELPAPEPLPGTADPAALPKIGPAPSG